MSNFIIKLGSITNNKNYFSFDIKDQFFESFSYSDLESADITANALLEKDGKNILLKLKIDGAIHHQACDICADEISVNVAGETNIIIKKTDENLESTDEIFYIHTSDNQIDLKHLIFELIVLNAPKKRKHPLDNNGNSTCNKDMVNLVAKYTQVNDKSSDPRWDALKKIK
tara:strand:- start:462 stop:974 length:513 start_codon:yes stop_codon:yes gene_type:complete